MTAIKMMVRGIGASKLVVVERCCLVKPQPFRENFLLPDKDGVAGTLRKKLISMMRKVIFLDLSLPGR